MSLDADSMPPRARWRAFALVLLSVCGVVVLVFAVTWLKSRSPRTGPRGTVTIEQRGAHKTLLLDGVTVSATDFASEAAARLEAHLPLLCHPDPKDVLLIGFGTGARAQAASLHPIARLDCVEPLEGVIEAAPEFKELNHGVLDDARVTVHTEDARAHMRQSRRTYDVIVSSPPHPVLVGNGALYTVEYFRDCARRLKPGGVFSTRLPTRDIRFEDYAVILRSVRAAFPCVYVWHWPAGRNDWTLITAFGTPGHPPALLHLKYSGLVERMAEPALAADLARIYFTSPVDLNGFFVLGPREVDTLVKGSAGFNTDENRHVERVAVPAIKDVERDTLFARTYAALLARRPAGVVFLDLRDLGEERGGEVVGQLGRRWWSSNRVFRGRLYELDEQEHRARAEWHCALDDDPTNEVARDLLGMTERALAEATALGSPAESQFRIGLYHVGHAGEATTPEEQAAQLDQAAAAFEKSLEHEPKQIAAYAYLARTYFNLDRHDDALAVTVRMRRNALCPSTEGFAQRLRVLVYALRRSRADRDDPQTWGGPAWCAERLQMDDLAVETLEDVAEALRQLGAWSVDKFLAGLEIRRGNFIAAAEHAQRASDEELVEKIAVWCEYPIRAVAEPMLRPPSPSAKEPPTDKEARERERASKHFKRGIALMDELDYDGARKEFERSIRTCGDFYSGYLGLAYLAEATGDYEAGLVIIGTWEEAEGETFFGSEMGTLRERLSALKALEDDGENPTLRHLNDLAFTYEADELTEEALLCCLRMEQMQPDDVAALVHVVLYIGRLYAGTSQPEKRDEYYEKARNAVAQAGDTLTAEQLASIGSSYLSTTSHHFNETLHDEGLEHLLRAERLDPNNVHVLLRLGRAHGRGERAMEYYERVLAIDPDNEEAKEGIESIRQQQQELEELRRQHDEEPFPELDDEEPAGPEPMSPR